MQRYTFETRGSNKTVRRLLPRLLNRLKSLMNGTPVGFHVTDPTFVSARTPAGHRDPKFARDFQISYAVNGLPHWSFVSPATGKVVASFCKGAYDLNSFEQPVTEVPLQEASRTVEKKLGELFLAIDQGRAEEYHWT